jgi:hypothetical protein
VKPEGLVVGISTPDGCLVGLGVWPMWSHAAVKTGASRKETISLCLQINLWFTKLVINSSLLTKKQHQVLQFIHYYLVYPVDEAHEFSHAVPMIVRRPECIFSNQPSRREYYKIK